MADIEFNCPKCGKHLSVDGKGAGLDVPCPECGKNIQVPTPAVPAPTSSADAGAISFPKGKGGNGIYATIIIAAIILAAAVVGATYLLSKGMMKLGDSIAQRRDTIADVNNPGIGRYQLYASRIKIMVTALEPHDSVEENRLFKIDTKTGETWYYDESWLIHPSIFTVFRSWKPCRDETNIINAKPDSTH